MVHSLYQKAFDIPVEEVSTTGDTVVLQIKSLNATYTGILQDTTTLLGGAGAEQQLHFST
ncbi:hypothetical protein [Pontibacter anaerobius]|uniref:Uncharacterized protein n=1 Tax=Pontibacter anaerobius TaxID=2993940 RepID=A0ABT3RC16_9BACT|nr:hypothetical protein [Pontibacter anaerobius]MCX2739062.1 hypothetical protein [Pontibacter anaerobius]